MHFLIEIILAAVALGLAIIAGAIYFGPTLIAYNRKHHNCKAIFVLNLFLGWSFIMWVVSLAWSLTKVEST